MTNAYWAALVIFTALVEATWLGLVRFQGVLPDLILVLVIFFALTWGEERAMFTGVIGGLLQDVAGDTGLGHHVLCLVLVGFFVGKVSHRLLVDLPAVKAGFVFVASIAHGILFTTIAYLQNPDMSALYTIGVNVIPSAFYTAVAAPIVFFVLTRSKRLGPPIQGSVG